MNALSRFLADQQLWIVGLSLFILMVTVRSLAERIRRRRSSAVGSGLSQAGEGLIATSMMGLLSLLIGFTFSLALARHELRRTLVVEEANAIGVAYMRAQLLAEPYRGDLSNVIISYAQVRQATGELAGPSQLAAQEHSEALQAPMWQRTAAAARTSEAPALANFLVQSVTRMIEVEGQRKAALAARIPPAVLIALMAYSVGVAAVFGYVAAGAHAHRRRIAWAMFLLVTLAFMLILDLDRPGDGLIRISEANMNDMVRALPSFAAQGPDR
ncbi:MAG: hypothetical protein IM653_11560 [Phenylobacterium sp.]|uniref:bestrophin-like domain n=2 Tax=Phenylobacterium sp. TaxID=1871053 RepID=UPI0025DB000F|nr:hypothetical protein [Phenylobacterium sp.]MCA6228078.1 hypothetical protein [Phenylobacterium sp.]MCA6231437.1 hypothetical protein [Phenylobacterium sp.]MCA6235753.1 hypothetical protein [Phenylobacterium sp.]MCA6248916.1 hypothetical protein [Phenylobacterium sp.]MCA6252653.1 hypothetical protein [Phenylobacterium sp.]